MEGLVKGLRAGSRKKTEIGDGARNFDIPDQRKRFSGIAVFALAEGFAARFDCIGQAGEPLCT